MLITGHAYDSGIVRHVTITKVTTVHVGILHLIYSRTCVRDLKKIMLVINPRVDMKDSFVFDGPESLIHVYSRVAFLTSASRVKGPGVVPMDATPKLGLKFCRRFFDVMFKPELKTLKRQIGSDWCLLQLTSHFNDFNAKF